MLISNVGAAMSDKRIANIFLAIMAGVLLFGSASVAGALKWIAIVVGVLLILHAAFHLLGAPFRKWAQQLRDAKAVSHDEFLMALGGILFAVLALFFFGYTLWLWVAGVPNPVWAAGYSEFGTVWICILYIGVGLLLFAALWDRRSRTIPALRYCLGIVVAIISPWFGK
jgi:hypothetical protein